MKSSTSRYFQNNHSRSGTRPSPKTKMRFGASHPEPHRNVDSHPATHGHRVAVTDRVSEPAVGSSSEEQDRGGGRNARATSALARNRTPGDTHPRECSPAAAGSAAVSSQAQESSRFRCTHSRILRCGPQYKTITLLCRTCGRRHFPVEERGNLSRIASSSLQRGGNSQLRQQYHFRGGLRGHAGSFPSGQIVTQIGRDLLWQAIYSSLPVQSLQVHCIASVIGQHRRASNHREMHAPAT